MVEDVVVKKFTFAISSPDEFNVKVTAVDVAKHQLPDPVGSVDVFRKSGSLSLANFVNISRSTAET